MPDNKSLLDGLLSKLGHAVEKAFTPPAVDKPLIKYPNLANRGTPDAAAAIERVYAQQKKQDEEFLRQYEAITNKFLGANRQLGAKPVTQEVNTELNRLESTIRGIIFSKKTTVKDVNVQEVKLDDVTLARPEQLTSLIQKNFMLINSRITYLSKELQTKAVEMRTLESNVDYKLRAITEKQKESFKSITGIVDKQVADISIDVKRAYNEMQINQKAITKLRTDIDRIVASMRSVPPQAGKQDFLVQQQAKKPTDAGGWLGGAIATAIAAAAAKAAVDVNKFSHESIRDRQSRREKEGFNWLEKILFGPGGYDWQPAHERATEADKQWMMREFKERFAKKMGKSVSQVEKAIEERKYQEGVKSGKIEEVNPLLRNVFPGSDVFINQYGWPNAATTETLLDVMQGKHAKRSAIKKWLGIPSTPEEKKKQDELIKELMGNMKYGGVAMQKPPQEEQQKGGRFNWGGGIPMSGPLGPGMQIPRNVPQGMMHLGGPMPDDTRFDYTGGMPKGVNIPKIKKVGDPEWVQITIGNKTFLVARHIKDAAIAAANEAERMAKSVAVNMLTFGDMMVQLTQKYGPEVIEALRKAGYFAYLVGKYALENVPPELYQAPVYGFMKGAEAIGKTGQRAYEAGKKGITTYGPEAARFIAKQWAGSLTMPHDIAEVGVTAAKEYGPVAVEQVKQAAQKAGQIIIDVGNMTAEALREALEKICPYGPDIRQLKADVSELQKQLNVGIPPLPERKGEPFIPLPERNPFGRLPSFAAPGLVDGREDFYKKFGRPMYAGLAGVAPPKGVQYVDPIRENNIFNIPGMREGLDKLGGAVTNWNPKFTVGGVAKSMENPFVNWNIGLSAAKQAVTGSPVEGVPTRIPTSRVIAGKVGPQRGYEYIQSKFFSDEEIMAMRAGQGGVFSMGGGGGYRYGGGGGGYGYGAGITRPGGPSTKPLSALETMLRGKLSLPQEVLGVEAGSWRNRVNISAAQGAASVRYNNPGAAWPRKRDELYGIQGYGVIGGGNEIGYFPTVVHGAAANFDLWGTPGQGYIGKTLRQAVTRWRNDPNSPVPAGYDPNQVLTVEMARDPNFMIPFFKQMAKHEAGRKTPITDQEWEQAYKLFQAGGVEKARELSKENLPPILPGMKKVAAIRERNTTLIHKANWIQEQARIAKINRKFYSDEQLRQMQRSGMFGTVGGMTETAAAGDVSGRPDLRGKSLQSALPQGKERFFHQEGRVGGVNKRLLNVLKESSKDLPSGYRVEMISGRDPRSTGTPNHPGGIAVDVKIYDDKGRLIPHDSNSPGWKHYESLYRSSVIRGEKMYPGEEFIWGGAWISGAAGRGDPMHYQIRRGFGAQSSRRYSFERGLSRSHPFVREGGQLTPAERAAYDASVRERMAEEATPKPKEVDIPTPQRKAAAPTPKEQPKPQEQPKAAPEPTPKERTAPVLNKANETIQATKSGGAITQESQGKKKKSGENEVASKDKKSTPEAGKGAYQKKEEEQTSEFKTARSNAADSVPSMPGRDGTGTHSNYCFI
jgi:hypothetical protein